MEPAGTTRLNREGDADVNQPLRPGTGSDNGQDSTGGGTDREQHHAAAEAGASASWVHSGLNPSAPTLLSAPHR